MNGPIVLHRVDIASPARDAEYEGWLSERERARSRRFARPELAARYIRAHGALRELLACRLGTDPGELHFERMPGGRPELAREPRCRFSLSHCVDLAVIAISDDAVVGVDVERSRRISAALIARLLPAWLVPPADPAALQRLGLEIWTCTEAALKSGGLGIGGLGALRLLPHAAEGTYCFELSAPHTGSGVVRTVELDSMHLGALAVRGRELPQYRFGR